jgi:alkylhydroperoxidase/carboxymuconolactone decarboxylase family protein YurZ
MSGNPLDSYKQFDPKLIELWNKTQALTYSEGALSPKFKLLIATAIDVENGAVQGAVALGKRALKMGSSKEEIVEALRVACSIGGNQAFFTAAIVLQNLFKEPQLQSGKGESRSEPL